ncbi:MAG TPA: phospholipase D-like domain-containing protein [Sandaracinaceae bacterium LLY-WYZ-13_1]|nr:phospholipase D-like domain-containing protein [Sandaracinaceae bacterium LLY-WYZ-13_1]
MSADEGFDLERRAREWLGEKVANQIDLVTLEQQVRRLGRLADRPSEGAWALAWELMLAQADAFASQRGCGAPRHPSGRVALPVLGATANARTGLVPGHVRAPVDLRSASVQELALVPGLGVATAKRLEGAFSSPTPPASLEDAISRSLLDPATFERIRGYVTLGASREGSARPPVSFARLAREAADRGELAGLLADFWAHAEQATYWPLDRPSFDPVEPIIQRGQTLYEELFPCDERALRIAPLWGQAYLRVILRLLRSSHQRVRVAMFGLCSSFNPKLRPLLEELVAAHERGVDVRVLHDADEQEGGLWADDIAFLMERGVPCRGIERLHERTVVVDDDLVSGSVGWTSQSIFRTDELSLHTRSADIATETVKSLDALWSEGAPADFWSTVDDAQSDEDQA